MIDPDHPLLRPLPVRLVLVAVPLVLSALAFSFGWVFPGAALALAGGYVFRVLFLP